jgi:hypothetical protein
VIGASDAGSDAGRTATFTAAGSAATARAAGAVCAGGDGNGVSRSTCRGGRAEALRATGLGMMNRGLLAAEALAAPRCIRASEAAST